VFITIIVLVVDKTRELGNDDNFSGGNLFYRYGTQIFNTTITIGVDSNNSKPPIHVASDLISFLTNEIKLQFGNMPNRFQCQVIDIIDRKMPTDQRKFIKTTIITKRKSEINYFILILGVGKQMVIHEFLYLKGQTKWYAPILFVMTSPLHIWGWFYPWLMKNFNASSNLKTAFNKSTYDFIDMITIVRGLSFLFSSKVKAFAQKEGLLTEDLTLVLNQSISNSQQININNSSRINLSKINSNLKTA
jgi:hypothetical protein